MRNLPTATTGGASTTTPGAVAAVRGGVADPYRAGAEWLVVNKLAHKQIAEVINAVFLPDLLQIEQRTAHGECILSGDYLPPLPVRASHASDERRMTDMDDDTFTCTGTDLPPRMLSEDEIV